jgi:uncharacterized protein YwlG (UPF0340 family)
LLAHGWWFSPGTPASSITKTGRHDIAEILLKVALKHNKSYLFYLDVLYCSHVNTMTVYPENIIEIDTSKPLNTFIGKRK